MAFSKEGRRKKIQKRIRKNVQGTSNRPRLSVYRSNSSIYCQLIDDVNGSTIVAASNKSEGVDNSGNKVAQAKEVGKAIANAAKSANIESVVFDRGGYLYHGRVKALAEGAREGGLSF